MLADPAAWMHRSNTKSQYAPVGTRANPTQDRHRTSRQAKKIGRLPTLSAMVPQNIGAREYQSSIQTVCTVLAIKATHKCPERPYILSL